MKLKKLPWTIRLLIALGLVMTILPTIFNEYIKIPDGLRGAIVGFGLGLEIVGLFRASRFRKAGALGCGVQESSDN